MNIPILEEDAIADAYRRVCAASNCRRLTMAVCWLQDQQRWLSLCGKHARRRLQDVKDRRIS